MECGRISDSELRDRLQKMGVCVGPITDLTRNVYVHKLSTLGGSKKQKKPLNIRSKTPPLPANGSTPASPSTPVTQQRPQGSKYRRTGATKSKNTYAKTPPSLSDTVSTLPPPFRREESPQHSSSSSPSASGQTSSSSTPPRDVSDENSPQKQPHPPQTMAGNMALLVVEQLILSFNKPDNFANDTVFKFQNGLVLFASRSILATQCPKMAQFLYPSEDRFPVTVTMATGQSTQYYVHPNEYVVDLKERIMLAQGYPIAEQNLILDQKPLINSTTLCSCGVNGLAVLTLMLVGSSATATTTANSFGTRLNPSLSIAHLSLGLNLAVLIADCTPVPPPTPPPQKLPLSPHLTSVVHVYDVPHEAFNMLLVYLYCRNLLEPLSSNKLGVYIVCYILGEFFCLPCFSQLCLSHVQALLTLDSALNLIKYAESINSPLLHDIAMGYIKTHHMA